MNRQPVRLITIAWGEKYIEQLFSLTLPAVLAPNNLPALARDFACELVIVTEEAWFERLRRHPVAARLRQYCTIELRPIDDLVNQPDAYGMTLTYGLFRGFEELGPAMIDRQLIFFNADFILADGSLRTIGEKIHSGERLILAPSYCVVSETVLPWLSARRDREHGLLAVPPREMAEVALRNRHNTIRGKTVNQRAFSVEWMDQFYWLVDERTLIGHQLPFAVVSMRPERVLTDMCTFWDYGIISEACPTTQRCIIADSDDFLMIELRSADTARDQLRLGWPEPKEIAGRLKQFITKDPISLARHTLLLHSDDLPADLDEAKSKLDRFVDSVLAELPPEPTHWVNHPIWAYHYPAFHQAREAFFGRRPAPAGSGRVAAVPEETGLPAPAAGWGLKPTVHWLYQRYFGRSPWFRPVHPRWADAQPAVKLLSQYVDARALIVSSADLPERLFGSLIGRHLTVGALGLPRNTWARSAGQADRIHIGGERPIEAELMLPGEARPQKLQIRSLDLVLHNETAGEIGPSKQGCIEVPLPLPPTLREKFALCIFELSAEDLHDLAKLLDLVLPWMQPDGKILVFHMNTNAEGAECARTLIGGDALWLDMPCTIHFVGSEVSLRAVNAFHSAIAGLRTRRPLAAAKALLRLAGACLAALRISKSEISHSRREPSVFTSFTLEIDVNRDAGAEAVGLDNERAIA
jgi:hypothetical protein